MVWFVNYPEGCLASDAQYIIGFLKSGEVFSHTNTILAAWSTACLLHLGQLPAATARKVVTTGSVTVLATCSH